MFKMNSIAETNSAKSSVKYTLAKVPQITAFFWIIKILSTGMGEATSDALVEKIGPAIAAPLALLLLFAALRLQFRTTNYVPKIYWLAVSMVAIFGTMAADVIHIVGVPYIFSASLYAVVLAIIFIRWYRSEATLSIHSINTRRREYFYWLTVFATFALGTALGDLTATTFSLGFLNSGLMFICIFLVPVVLHYLFKINSVFTFWFAYIVTRPLGASFADWLGKPKSIGGLGIGDPAVSLVAIFIIVLLVTYLSFTQNDSPPSVK
jgi:uncharacterized membrane-anchored protein